MFYHFYHYILSHFKVIPHLTIHCSYLSKNGWIKDGLDLGRPGNIGFGRFFAFNAYCSRVNCDKNSIS